MATQLELRQRIRKGLIITSLLLFPVIMNYLSPYVIIDGASQGIVNGSLIIFGLQFLSALFVGRLWCGWACPMSLDVNGMVQVGAMEHGECILCGTCVDVCPKDVIRYSFSRGK